MKKNNLKLYLFSILFLRTFFFFNFTRKTKYTYVFQETALHTQIHTYSSPSSSSFPFPSLPCCFHYNRPDSLRFLFFLFFLYSSFRKASLLPQHLCTVPIFLSHFTPNLSLLSVVINYLIWNHNFFICYQHCIFSD